MAEGILDQVQQFRRLLVRFNVDRQTITRPGSVDPDLEVGRVARVLTLGGNRLPNEDAVLVQGHSDLLEVRCGPKRGRSNRHATTASNQSDEWSSSTGVVCDCDARRARRPLEC